SGRVSSSWRVRSIGSTIAGLPSSAGSTSCWGPDSSRKKPTRRIEVAHFMQSFSVIITACNCAAVVERTLRRAEQALAFCGRQGPGTPAPRGEAVIVDDGSTDGTERVVADFARNRADWVVVRRERPSSPSCARNTGVQRSKGELLFFLDGDDLFLPE